MRTRLATLLLLLLPAAAFAQSGPTVTSLPLVIVRSLPRKGAAPHAAVYAQTLAPVLQGGHVVLPAGTTLTGELQALTQPGFFRPHATLTVHFPQAVLSNNYVLSLDDELANTKETVQLTVAVTLASPVLLDTGTTFDLPLRTPLAIDPARLPATSTAPGPQSSSNPCTPTAGTPGTPDTVIPGSPGTPPTVIPSADGISPPTVIPGIPPTPPTVIPGTPGTPGTACPSAPRVTAVTLVP